MRRIAWLLLLLYVFTVPWEYSLDLGAPFGNIARIVGLLLLLAAVPAVLQSGRIRVPGPVQLLVLALFLWLFCTSFWTIDSVATLTQIRGFFQEMMIVWLVWEFAETPRDLRSILRVWIAGSWVLALLTLANFTSPDAFAAGQYRFAAFGQDPNDVARFLDFGFPLAALLANTESRWPQRILAFGYLPLGLVAVLLTASRGGFIAAVVALIGCGILLVRGKGRIALGIAFAIPPIAAALWLIIPQEVFTRLATIPQQLQSGDLNQRMNIWSAGWTAFTRAPFLGTGAGTFVNAAGLSPMDTAHNTALSLAVAGGLCALFLATAILVLGARAALQTQGSLRVALVFTLLVWAVTSLVANVEESRTTWLLFAALALAGRLNEEDTAGLTACFSDLTGTCPAMESFANGAVGGF